MKKVVLPHSFNPGKTIILFAMVLFSSASIKAQNPVLVWAKAIGGTGADQGTSIATDASGNVYTTGYFSGTTDFDPGAGTFNLTATALEDVFISKLDASGNFAWAKQMGGTGDDEGRSIKVDASGNVFTTGIFLGTVDFDPGAGTFNLTSAGGTDIFISKLDASGNFVWAKTMGGTGGDESYGIGTDASGNVFTSGSFIGTVDFDPGAGTSNLTSAGLKDIFISKLDASGNFVWAKAMGGTGNDETRSLATDASGNVLTTGIFVGTVDFDPGTSTFNLTASGAFQGFISKLDASGNFVWAVQLGTRSVPGGIVVDALGNVFSTGAFDVAGDYDPGPGTFFLSPIGSYATYISKLDASGNFVWAKIMTGATYSYTWAMAIDPLGNVYTTGLFTGTFLGLTSTGSFTLYISKHDALGNFVYAFRVAATTYAAGRSVAIDPAGNLLFTGGIVGTGDFDPGAGTFNLTSNGAVVDIFVYKLAPSIPIPTIANFTPAFGPIGTTVTITGTNFSAIPANNIVFFGATQATVDAATATQLTVDVPIGATYESISVSAGGLTAHAARPFVVTFSGGGNIDDCSFAPSTTIATTPPFVGPAFADVDGDGKPDMLIPNYTTSNFLSIFRNISTPGAITPGSFAPKIDFAAGTEPVSIAVGDLDGDGERDIAVINHRGGKISVYKNQSTPGTISLAARVDFTIPDFADDVSIADMDGDGKLDLTITTSLVGLTVLRNTGTPGIINASTFAAGVNFATGPNAFPFVLGDIDGDGKLDAAVPNANAYFVSLLRNTSTPGIISFATQSLTITTGSPAVGGGTLYTVLGDIDGDNKLDLVVTTNTVNTVSLFRNTSVIGSLSFDPKFDIVFPTTRNTPALSDLDGDGKIELIVDRTTTEISVYKNLSSAGAINAASFAAPVIIPRSASTVLFAGDVDGDGRSEIISSSGPLQIFRNTIGTIPLHTITSFSPASGPIGSTVTITGTNFSTTPANNVVNFFNNQTATVTASTATTITVTVPSGTTTGKISVTINCITVQSATNFSVGAAGPPTITINTQPSDFSGCDGAIATLTTAATGTTNIAYQWQFSTTPAGTFNDISNGLGYSNATTSTLSVNTTGNFGAGYYRSKVTGDLAPAVFSNAALVSVNSVPKPVVVTSNCSASAATLSGPSGFTNYAWSNGPTTQQITVTAPGTYTLVVTASSGCTSPPSNPASFTSAFCNQPPVIATASANTVVAGTVTINLSLLLTDPDDNLDLSTLKIISQPESGAVAAIDASLNLTIDYTGVAFAGTDHLILQVCDMVGVCAQRDVAVEVAGEITVFNAMSPNGDGKNDIFFLKNINSLPETKSNRVTVYNRWGDAVFEADNYDNVKQVFAGLNKNGTELPTGTYFYKIEFTSGKETQTGYISLKR